jgi:hypothetical protein
MVSLEVKVHTAADNSTLPGIASAEASKKNLPTTATAPQGKVTVRPAPTDVSLHLRVPNPSTDTRLNESPSPISERTCKFASTG